MNVIETLDKWYALAPDSFDGKAFQAAMQLMINRFFQSASQDKSTPPLTFILADDASPYMRQETYEGKSAIIISKGLIASTQDEDTLAAMLAYQLLQVGVLPQRTNIVENQRRAPIDRTVQVIDYMRDAGYSEQGMMRALELLNNTNSKHALQAFDTVMGQEISDTWRDFGTRMELAKRTRGEGWQESTTSISTMKNFSGTGDYRDFQMDVASAKRSSRLDNWLELKGYDGADLTERGTLLQEALAILPTESKEPYMALWKDLSQHTYHLDKALLEAGQQKESNILRATFQQAADDAGVKELLYVTEEAIPPHYIQTIKHNEVAIQDGFGFLLPLPLVLDNYIYATINPLEKMERTNMSLNAGAVQAHALQWSPLENEPHILKDFRAWLDSADHQNHIRDRLEWEKKIVIAVRETSLQNTALAAQMAHYAITSCKIIEPSVFNALIQHWKEGIPILIGTEANPIGGNEAFHSNIKALTAHIIDTSGQRDATKLLDVLASAIEAQPSTAFMLEDRLQEKQQWDEKRFGYGIGVGEWIGEILVDEPIVRTSLLKMLMQQNPGTILLEKLESIVAGYVASVNDEDRAKMDEEFEATIQTVKHYITLGKVLEGEQFFPQCDAVLRDVEQIHETLREFAANPDKASEIAQMGIKAYVASTSGNTIEIESLESLLNLSSRAFWDTKAEARGLVTTALLFADGRTPDSLMPMEMRDTITKALPSADEGLVAANNPQELPLTIRDFIKLKVIPESLDADTRLQVETFIDSYTNNTNPYDCMAILGYALALSKPIDSSDHDGLSEGVRQGQVLTQVLSSFGPLGVKFAQAIEGMPHISNEIRTGMSSSKERAVDMPRWEYLHAIMDRITPEVQKAISNYGPVLAAGSNQFTGIATYQGRESALTCLHNSVRERAAFEATMLQEALRAVMEEKRAMGDDTASLQLAQGLLKRAHEVMQSEHSYTIGQWQVQTAQEMYNTLEVKIGDMPVHFKVVDWKAHGKDFKIESLAKGRSFKELCSDPNIDKAALKNLAKSIQTVENMWLGSGQIFDSDRHGANLKAEPLCNKDGSITGWQVNIFDVGALLTERPTRKARVALGKAIGEALTISEQQGVPFGATMQTTLLRYAQEAEQIGEKQIANYLYEVPKAELAKQDYAEVFTPEERQANGIQMMRTLLLSGRVDVSIAQGIAMTAGNTLFHKAKETMGSNVQNLFNRERRQPLPDAQMHDNVDRDAVSPNNISVDNIKITGGRSVKMHALPV